MRRLLPVAVLLALATPALAEDPAPDLVALDIVSPETGAKMSGDPGKGETEFKKCQVCHTLEDGVNKVGPSLHKIIGRTAGSVEGFNYSKANKESGVVWTEQNMWEYLANPKAFIPGTKMAFAGIKDGQKRADLIAYIQGHSN
jgi:cytochrome c